MSPFSQIPPISRDSPAQIAPHLNRQAAPLTPPEILLLREKVNHLTFEHFQNPNLAHLKIDHLFDQRSSRQDKEDEEKPYCLQIPLEVIAQIGNALLLHECEKHRKNAVCLHLHLTLVGSFVHALKASSLSLAKEFSPKNLDHLLEFWETLIPSSEHKALYKTITAAQDAWDTLCAAIDGAWEHLCAQRHISAKTPTPQSPKQRFLAQLLAQVWRETKGDLSKADPRDLFLLNDNKELVSQGVFDTLSSQEVAHLAKLFAKIESLDFRPGAGFAYETLKHFDGLSDLKLRGLGPKVISSIAALFDSDIHLRSLALIDSHLDSKDIQTIANLQLRHLSVRGGSLSHPKFLTSGTGLSLLQSLEIHGSIDAKTAVDLCIANPKLQKLKLSNTEDLDKELMRLCTVAKDLRHLDLTGCQNLGPGFVALVQANPQLESLHCDDRALGYYTDELSFTLRSLKTFSSMHIPDFGKTIASHASLEELVLFDEELEDTDILALASHAKNMRKLCLSLTPSFSSKALKVLGQSLIACTTVGFVATRYIDYGVLEGFLEAIARVPSLWHFSIEYYRDPPSQACLDKICSLKTLRALNFNPPLEIALQAVSGAPVTKLTTTRWLEGC